MMYAATITTVGVLCCLAVGRDIDAQAVQDGAGDDGVKRVSVYRLQRR